jgi:hypothetical protein
MKRKHGYYTVWWKQNPYNVYHRKEELNERIKLSYERKANKNTRRNLQCISREIQGK